MHISAIDLGFLYTKAIINGKKVIMKSVVGDSKQLMFEDLNLGDNGKDHIKAKVGMEEYFVSDLAVDQSDAVLHSLKGKRFDSDTTEVLVKSAFALGQGSDNTEHCVVSGLPVSHFAQYKDDIVKLFLGDRSRIHNYEVWNNSKPIRGSVRVVDGKFIPQPFGAAVHKLLDDKGQIIDKELAGKTITVIDPGFGTTDVFTMSAFSPVEKLSFSTRTAMNHAYKLIAGKIEENFGVYLQLHELESIVRSGEFKKNGKTYSMEKTKNWAFKATAQQLLAEITNKAKSLHEIDQFLLAGGGGIALSKYIIPEFENIELLDDAQWAVVNGYYKWGVRNFA